MINPTLALDSFRKLLDLQSIVTSPKINLLNIRITNWSQGFKFGPRTRASLVNLKQLKVDFSLQRHLKQKSLLIAERKKV